jgi:Zn finger protein HypA/HybF involved in hydrogenase expression
MASSRYTVDQVSEAILESKSWREVCEKVGLTAAGGNAGTLKNLALAYELDCSHFLGQGWNLGGEARNEISPEKVFIRDSSYVSNSGLKKKVIKYDIVEHRCSECGLEGEWNSKPIELHLDHVSGDRRDNRPDNLRFLCPNCHSQTTTYCRHDMELERKNFCSKCGKKIWRHNSKRVCIKCQREAG